MEGHTQQRLRPPRRFPLALSVWVLLILVVLLILTLVGLRFTLGQAAPVNKPVAQASSSVVEALTSIAPSLFDSAVASGSGLPQAQAPVVVGRASASSPRLRPVVLYVSAEFCPYCAAESWVIAVALSRFGKFSDLYETASSKDEAFPNTPALSFAHSTFSSRWIAFDAVEMYGATPSSTSPGGFSLLETPGERASELMHSLDTGSILGPNAGSLPFLDVANVVVAAGSGVAFSPGLLAGMTVTQVARSLGDPTSAISRVVLGAADEISASICAATAGQPSAVCNSPGVRLASVALGLS